MYCKVVHKINRTVCCMVVKRTMKDARDYLVNEFFFSRARAHKVKLDRRVDIPLVWGIKGNSVVIVRSSKKKWLNRKW